MMPSFTKNSEKVHRLVFKGSIEKLRGTLQSLESRTVGAHHILGREAWVGHEESPDAGVLDKTPHAKDIDRLLGPGRF